MHTPRESADDLTCGRLKQAEEAKMAIARSWNRQIRFRSCLRLQHILFALSCAAPPVRYFRFSGISKITDGVIFTPEYSKPWAFEFTEGQHIALSFRGRSRGWRPVLEQRGSNLLHAPLRLEPLDRLDLFRGQRAVVRLVGRRFRGRCSGSPHPSAKFLDRWQLLRGFWRRNPLRHSLAPACFMTSPSVSGVP